MAREWLARVHQIKVAPGHAERTRIRLEQDAFLGIVRRPLAEVEVSERLEVLRRVEGRGTIGTVHRLRGARARPSIRIRVRLIFLKHPERGKT